ncbi:hypothetical protein GCM10020331_016240 [Ectobacillus funiculus]
MSHGDLVTGLPEGFVVDATSASCPIAAMSNEARGFYGVQFHPEVRHSEYGNDLLKKTSYLRFAAAAKAGTWVTLLKQNCKKIRETVGDKKRYSVH